MAEETARRGSIYGGAAEPCSIVLFGASGDLAKRKVIPAMYDLAQNGSLGERYTILGFARTPMTDDSFRSTLGEAAMTISEVGPIEPAKWNEFASNLYYSPGDYKDPESYAKLAKRLDELDAQKNLGGNRLFYLSTPPEVYQDIVEHLGSAGLARPCKPGSWVRIIIEKPFGRDLASAKELNKIVLNVFEESRFTASIIIWARIRCRTCWCCASGMAFLSRCGIATMWITCRLPLRKRWEWSAGVDFMKQRGLCGT